MDSVVLQAAIAAPLVFGLSVYTVLHRDRSGLHLLLAALLCMILVWMVGIVMTGVATEGPAHRLGLLLVGPATVAMSPVYFLAMTRFARLRFFEDHRAADLAIMAPFALYYLAFLTNPWHGLAITGPVVNLATTPDPHSWAGPIWWGFQFCATATAFGGLAICARVAIAGATHAERRRALLLVAAVVFPMATHLAYVLELSPVDASLTPASLAVTSLLIGAAIQRYQLLEPRPLARRDVIEALRDGVLLADADGVTVDVNPAAAEILGRARDELRGLRIEAALAPVVALEGDLEKLQQQFAGEREGVSMPDVHVQTPGGYWLEVTAGTTGTGKAGLCGLFVVIRDRTRERRTEQQLHQSQRLESVGVLAAGVAHEVNNPLAFVRSNLEYMSETIEALKQRADEIPEDLRGDLVECQGVLTESTAGIERIGAIVAGLLRFSRAPSDELAAVDVNSLVEESLRLASLQGSRGIRVEARLESSLPFVDASAGRLVQVLLNLLLNAKQALRNQQNGTVEVETARVDAWVEIRVRDDGPGIPEDVLGRIFDPFFTTREPGEGTGLGLSIAYDIVQEHAGQLVAESDIGGGARFTVRLPIPAHALEGRSDNSATA